MFQNKHALQVTAIAALFVAVFVAVGNEHANDQFLQGDILAQASFSSPSIPNSANSYSSLSIPPSSNSSVSIPPSSNSSISFSAFSYSSVSIMSFSYSSFSISNPISSLSVPSASSFSSLSLVSSQASSFSFSQFSQSSLSLSFSSLSISRASSTSRASTTSLSSGASTSRGTSTGSTGSSGTTGTTGTTGGLGGVGTGGSYGGLIGIGGSFGGYDTGGSNGGSQGGAVPVKSAAPAKADDCKGLSKFTRTCIPLVQPLGGSSVLTLRPGALTFFDYFNEAADLILTVAVGFAVLWILIGSYFIMVSGSDGGKRSTGKSIITWALIGLILVNFAGFFLRTLNSIFFV